MDKFWIGFVSFPILFLALAFIAFVCLDKGISGRWFDFLRSN